MIKLKELISHFILERMSYAQLMNASDPKRKERALRIPSKSLIVKSVNGREAWKFSYKTPKRENTTGLRHQGFIYFFKDWLDDVERNNEMNIECSVDCSCPDYKYRWAYNNAKADAGELGGNALNKNNGAPPQINLGVGLCKHLLSLKEYLNEKIVAALPASSPVSKKNAKPPVVPKSPPTEKTPVEEPEPEIEEPFDTTQSPDPEKEMELQDEPETPLEDPTQTPQGPEENPEMEPEKKPVKKIDKNKKPSKPLKEGLSSENVAKVFDKLCENNKIFII
jgi:hypothetical protein